jgi:hypothetical protein
MAKKLYQRKLWAGFSDGRLFFGEMDTGWGGYGSGDGMRRMPSLFTTKREAREQFQDARQVEIRELPKRRAPR